MKMKSLSADCTPQGAYAHSPWIIDSREQLFRYRNIFLFSYVLDEYWLKDNRNEI